MMRENRNSPHEPKMTRLAIMYLYPIIILQRELSVRSKFRLRMNSLAVSTDS
jgi:hypothetical protein